MPRKKDGMLFEIHPSPAKGKDGKSIVYVRPAGNLKLSMKGLEDYCNRNYRSLYGEIERSFDYFLRAAGELMAMGYRIETPIGSFAPRLRLLREITDPDEVKGMDVVFDGVDYNPGKLWNREMEKWHDGFRKAETTNVQELMADKEKLEQKMRECLQKHQGYITAGMFSRYTGLTLYSAFTSQISTKAGNSISPPLREPIYSPSKGKC